MENSLSPIRNSPPLSMAGGPPRGDISLAEMWAVIRKHKWLIAGCIGFALALAAVYCLKSPRRYEATARVVINPDSAVPLGITGDEMNRAADPALMQETQVRIMQSDTVAWDVIRQLRLDENPDFLAVKSAEKTQPPEASPARRFALMTEFHHRLNVASVPKTALVELRFRSRNPKLAADIVTATANAYLERNFRTHFNANMQVSEWLSKQLDDLKKKVESSQQEFVDFQRKNGIIGTDETHNIVISQLDELNKRLATAQADRILREAQYREALGVNPEVIAEIAPTATLQALRTQLADLNNQYAELSAKYGEAYPRVEQLRTRLEQVESSLQREELNVRQRLEAEYQAAARAEKMASDEVEKTKQQAYKMNEAGIEYLILKREGDASRDLYEDLMKKLNEAGITAGLKSTNVAVVDPAEIPVLPAEPLVLLSLLVAFGVGSSGGVGLAFLLENLDDTISSPAQAEWLAGLPVLCVVPHVKLRLKTRSGTLLQNPERIKPLSLLRPQSTFAEAFRALRTTLLLGAPGAAPRVLVITSAIPGEGKTITAINIATTLAQSQRRVLLVDADMQSICGMQARLDIVGSEGLSQCLSGKADFAAALVSIPELPTLHILLAGEAPALPTELLWSDRMRDLMRQWRTDYDHVVLDTPSVLGRTDAAILATMSDAVLMVVRCAQTGRQTLCRASDLLARVHARTLGIVVNDLNLNSSEHYGYYGYYGDVCSEHYRDRALKS